MTPAVEDGPVTVYQGDALAVLREMPSESVHCVVTSPPYWGLRDYGATGQLGLEATPELYVEHMVEVFREVRRVLRADGTCWVNLGDSYASGPYRDEEAAGRHTLNGRHGHADNVVLSQRRSPIPPGLKPKDLVGIPWRLAFALQADGWYLRSDIIWSKPNPMPESVTDRPTKAHEYLFLLTRSPRYFYDADAVREAHEEPWRSNGKAERNNWSVMGQRGSHETVREYNPHGRNLRSVWEIATQPYPEAHFATFPEDLVIPCIKAGTSEHGCCAECGAPWRRVVERTKPQRNGEVLPSARDGGLTTQDGLERTGLSHFKYNEWLKAHPPQITGWEPSRAHCPCSVGEHCCCKTEPTAATVLDPFAGSGTALAVARRLGRRAVGIELQADYLPLIRHRISEAALPLLEAAPEPEVFEQLAWLAGWMRELSTMPAGGS